MAKGKHADILRAVPARVLIVEDDAILAMSLEATFLDAGTRTVRVSSSTSDAMDALKSGRFDALVLDVHLADRDDGYAIAELVSGFGPEAPRIVFSTGAPDDIPADVAKLGCVLEKPYAPEELIAILAQPKRAGIISRLRKRFVAA